jgi:hypothetical protein
MYYPPPEAEHLLDEAAQLLNVPDHRKEECRQVLSSLASKIIHARNQAANLLRPSDIRSGLRDIAKAADNLVDKLNWLHGDQRYSAINRRRWFAQDWLPEDTQKIHEALANLSRAAHNAAEEDMLQDKGGQVKYGICGTIDGFMARSVVYLLDDLNLPIPKSNSGIHAQICGKLYEYTTGKAAPETVFDKATKAAMLLRFMRDAPRKTEEDAFQLTKAEEQLDEL